MCWYKAWWCTTDQFLVHDERYAAVASGCILLEHTYCVSGTPSTLLPSVQGTMHFKYRNHRIQAAVSGTVPLVHQNTIAPEAVHQAPLPPWWRWRRVWHSGHMTPFTYASTFHTTLLVIWNNHVIHSKCCSKHMTMYLTPAKTNQSWTFWAL